MDAGATAASYVAAFVAGFLAALIVLAAFIVGQLAMMRPWDASAERTHKYIHKLPRVMFYVLAWQYRLAQLAQQLLPAPVYVADLATAFVSTRIVCTLIRLDLPGQLQRLGPANAEQLAKACGVVHAAWLERVLDAAADLNLLRRKRARAEPGAGVAGGASCVLYAANAATAVLCEDHPCSMAAFALLQEAACDDMLALADAMRQGVPAVTVRSGGSTFWEWLKEDAGRAANFDAAMQQVEHLGAGLAVVEGYSAWRRASTVIDVAGGIGSFVARVLAKHPKVSGVVFDRPGQVARGQQWYQEHHPALVPRVAFVAGDMFDADTLPRPVPDGLTVYVLRMILHDWGDEMCVKLLTALRCAVGADHTSKVRLAIVEMALVRADEAPLAAAHITSRHRSDLTMLTNFGDGMERSRMQFAALLAAADWRLRKVLPMTGTFFVIEAEPA